MKRLIIAIALLAFTAPALAQQRALTGNPVKDIRSAVQRTDSTDGVGGGSGGPLSDILGAFDDKLLVDLKFALNIADKGGNQMLVGCWSEWIRRIESRQQANLGADGQPIDPPSPRVITDFTKLMLLRDALQPSSPFMTACLPVAATVKKDIAGLIGAVLTGGAGLAKLLPIL